jgi:hypothetical protein
MKIEGEVAGGEVVEESVEKRNLRESREKGEQRKVNESKTNSSGNSKRE